MLLPLLTQRVAVVPEDARVHQSPSVRAEVHEIQRQTLEPTAGRGYAVEGDDSNFETTEDNGEGSCQNRVAKWKASYSRDQARTFYV